MDLVSPYPSVRNVVHNIDPDQGDGGALQNVGFQLNIRIADSLSRCSFTGKEVFSFFVP
jgi:hypothetical protein